jgi:hypothetical protein
VLKISFYFGKHVSYWFKTLLGILEKIRNWFELIWIYFAKFMKQIGKQKKKKKEQKRKEGRGHQSGPGPDRAHGPIGLRPEPVRWPLPSAADDRAPPVISSVFLAQDSSHRTELSPTVHRLCSPLSPNPSSKARRP